MLARTLVDRPDLSGKVCILYLGLKHDLVESAAGLYSLDRGIRHGVDVSEALYIGDVLNRIENLRRLDLHMKGEVGWLFPSATNAIVSLMLGRNAPYGLNKQLDLSVIPGLQNLKPLRLSGPNVHWEWLCLPQLKRVHIGIGCTLLEPYRSTETCHLLDLIIERFTDLVHLDLPPDGRL